MYYKIVHIKLTKHYQINLNQFTMSFIFSLLSLIICFLIKSPCTNQCQQISTCGSGRDTRLDLCTYVDDVCIVSSW